MCHLEIRTDRWQNRRFRPNSLVQVVYDRSLAQHAMDIENILSHQSSKKKSYTVQMINIFEKRKLLGDENVIDGAQMLCILGKPNSARVRDNRHSESVFSYEEIGISTF